jgi:hypothetical protein
MYVPSVHRQACRSRPYVVRLCTIYDYTVGGGMGDFDGTWIRDVDPLVAILRSILRGKERIFNPERIKSQIKCPHNSKENQIVIL